MMSEFSLRMYIKWTDDCERDILELFVPLKQTNNGMIPRITFFLLQ